MNVSQKPNGIWIVDLRSLGKGRVSLGTRDKAEARRRVPRAIAGERFNEDTPVRGRPATVAVASSLTMAELFRRCMNDKNVWMQNRSQATLRSNDKILCGTEVPLDDGSTQAFGLVPVTDVSANVLEGLVKVLSRKGYAQSSIKRKMDMVNRSLRLALKWRLIDTCPESPRIKVLDNARQRVVREHEEEAIFKAIAAREKEHPTSDWKRFGHAIRFLLHTGCRKGEMENLRSEWIEKVELGDRTVHRLTIPSWVAKNGKKRTIPLTSAVVDSLPELTALGVPAPAHKPKGLLLFPYTGSFFWYRWKIIVRDLKEEGLDLTDVVLHSFRHTCLTRLSVRGMPIEKVADWAGHSDISITMKHYRHAEASDLDIGVSLLER